MNVEDVSTEDKVVMSLNSAWQDIEHGINAAYDEGYSALVWKMKHIQLQIENLETDIIERNLEDEE